MVAPPLPGRPHLPSAVTPSTVIAADWSGALRAEARTLRVATVAHGTVRAVAAASREQAGDVLLDAAGTDPSLVAGLDFSFSMPGWWLDACGITEVGHLWDDADRLEGWLQRCAPPFWGRPGRPRPTLAGDPLRLTERSAPGNPGSVFQIGGAGAVGTASLRGMPTLARLRAAGFSVWPFDPWRPPVVLEVWPRLAIGGLVKTRAAERDGWARRHGERLARPAADAVRRSPDALDAAAAALWLADRPGPRPNVDDPLIRKEGWIDGVPLPGGDVVGGDVVGGDVVGGDVVGGDPEAVPATTVGA